MEFGWKKKVQDKKREYERSETEIQVFSCFVFFGLFLYRRLPYSLSDPAGSDKHFCIHKPSTMEMKAGNFKNI